MMPEQPNQSENLLKRYAQERRAQGGDFAPHPATRRLLQGEVRRTYGPAPAGGRPGWLGLLFNMRGSLALGLACLVIGTFLIQLWTPAPDQPLPLASRSLERASAPASATRLAMDADSDALTVNAAGEVAGLPVVIASSGAGRAIKFTNLSDDFAVNGQAGHFFAFRGTAAAASNTAHRPDVLAGIAWSDPAWMAPPGYFNGFEQLTDRSLLRWDLNSTQAVDAYALSYAGQWRENADFLDRKSGTPVPMPGGLGGLGGGGQAPGPVAARSLSEQLASAPVVASKPSESALGAERSDRFGETWTVTEAESLQRRSYALKMQVPAAPQDSRLDGAAPASPAPAAAPRALGARAEPGTVAASGPVRSNVPLESRFSREKDFDTGLRAGGAGRGAVPQQGVVLNNFSIEQSGASVRLVDGDGSVYEGTVQQAPLAGEPQGESNTTLGLQKEVSRPAATRARFRAEPQSFRAVGSNLTLRQMIVVNGHLNESAPATATPAVRDKNSQAPAGSKDAPVSLGTPAAPASVFFGTAPASNQWLNFMGRYTVATNAPVSLEGTVQIGSSNQQWFRAVRLP